MADTTPAETGKAKSADRWLLPVLGRAVVIAGLAVSAFDIVILRHGRFIPGAFEGLGLALFVAGIAIYVAARLTLGRFFSETVEIKPGHRLIMRGPYRYIRHPIYLAVILFAFSIPTVLGSLYGFVTILALMPMLIVRVRFEEKVLASTFGQEYVEYVRKTKRLIPYIY
ncbi:MAG: isoprenylcysteine carboxylmethyltransferase family protein [archaeon]|nr:MAG: isoprenylcysteine carboxylmethyltransferase family protein [archaeon]